MSRHLFKAGYVLSKMFSSRKKGVVFVHVPKCGGTSINTALKNQFAGFKSHHISSGAARLAGEHILKPASPTEFTRQNPTQLQYLLVYLLNLDNSYISGHMPVTTSIIENYQNRYDFITVLRNPVERFISNYIFNKMTNANPLLIPNNLSFENLEAEVDQVLTSERGLQLASMLSMMITGRYPTDKQDAISMQSEFKSSLSKFKVIGFLDDLEGFANSCHKNLGKKPSIGILNKTKRSFSESEQQHYDQLVALFKTPEVRTAVENLCAVETDNYQHAKQLYG
jgi:hypothetical protein